MGIYKSVFARVLHVCVCTSITCLCLYKCVSLCLYEYYMSVFVMIIYKSVLVWVL